MSDPAIRNWTPEETKEVKSKKQKDIDIEISKASSERGHSLVKHKTEDIEVFVKDGRH